MMKILNLAIAATCATALSACATSPDKVTAHYVPSSQYSHLTCDQVQTEIIKVSDRVAELTGAQQKDAESDAVAVGVGLVLFWPALFFLAGDDHSAELGRLKGEYEALETQATEKQCEIAQALEAAKIERQRKEAEAKEKLRQQPVVI